MTQMVRRGVVAGPPAYKMATSSKIIHMTAIMGAIFAFPAYVVFNVKNYKKRD